MLNNLWLYLKQNRVQVLLGSLSMAIAVVCMHVIGTMSYVLEQELLQQISLMGTDLLLGYIHEDIDMDFLDIGVVDSYSLVRSEFNDEYTLKYVQPSYFQLYKMECLEGRLFTYYDEGVVVLGSGVDGYEVGDVFTYNHQLYRVIGILKEVSESFYGDDNECVFVPYIHSSNFQVLIKSNNEERVNQYFSWCFEDYELLSQKQVKEGMMVLWDLLESVLFVIVGVSLVVCLVGIMNVSLLNVNGRLNEIGIRKAIGASDVSLFLQFVVEVMSIGIVGYIVGSFVSIIFVFLLCWYLNCSFYMNFALFLVLFVICLLVSVLGGLLPAYLACKKDVIEVL